MKFSHCFINGANINNTENIINDTESATQKKAKANNVLQLLFLAFPGCKFINNIFKAHRFFETLFNGHNTEITDVILRQG